jgi:hypothetical protein
MEKFFDGFNVRYIPRLDNRDVDHLGWIASSRAPILSEAIVEKLTKPSVKLEETLRETDLMIIDGAEQQPEIDWMSPIKVYLDNQPISDDNAEIERIARTQKPRTQAPKRNQQNNTVKLDVGLLLIERA